MTATEQQGRATEILRSVGAILDHVAHAVPSIAEVLPIYRDLLGGRAYASGIHPVAHHAAVHVVFPDGGKIELLEPTSSTSASVGKFLAEHPRGGLHHLTFRIDNLSETLEILESAGYSPFGTNRSYEQWKETFLHPSQTGGVLIQLAQAAAGFPPPMSISIDQMLTQASEIRISLAEQGGAA